MKIGVVVVVTRETNFDSVFCSHLKNQHERLQTMIWNTRGDFANFVDDAVGTSKTVLSHTSDHMKIVSRIQRMKWFQDCDAIVIINFGEVFLTVKDDVVELSSPGRDHLTIVESKVPIKVAHRMNDISEDIEILLQTGVPETELIKVISDLRAKSKHSTVITIIDKIKSSFSPTNQYLIWYEESISSYYVKENHRGKEACEKLLRHPVVPQWMKNSANSNLKYYQ